MNSNTSRGSEHPLSCPSAERSRMTFWLPSQQPPSARINTPSNVATTAPPDTHVDRTREHYSVSTSLSLHYCSIRNIPLYWQNSTPFATFTRRRHARHARLRRAYRLAFM